LAVNVSAPFVVKANRLLPAFLAAAASARYLHDHGKVDPKAPLDFSSSALSGYSAMAPFTSAVAHIAAPSLSWQIFSSTRKSLYDLELTAEW